MNKTATTSSSLHVEALEDELSLVTECLAGFASDRMHSTERNWYNWSVCFPASIVLTFGMTLSQEYLLEHSQEGRKKKNIGFHGVLNTVTLSL